jgi:ribosomal protein L15
MLSRQTQIKDDIYKIRHGERSELGNYSDKHRLGHQEHKLHEAHKAINEYGKLHPETGVKSPATRDVLKNMDQGTLKEFSKTLNEAASQLQTVSRTLNRLKEGDLVGEMKGQLKSSAEQAVFKAVPALATASKIIQTVQQKILDLGMSR